MNTQTHLLLATAVLLPMAPALVRGGEVNASASVNKPTAYTVTLAALIGALLPDVSLYLMFVIAKVQGVDNNVIFNEWYFSHTWQNLGAMTNSIPLYLTIAAFTYAMRVHWVCVGAIAALLHCLTDLPLHHNDGHPHFWPFSDWIYSSPVSYWDPNHFGNQWAVFEWCVAAWLIVFLWRRSAKLLSRSLLVLAAISYAVVAFYWLTAFA